MRDGEGKRAQAQAALEEALPLAVQTVIDIARDATDQRALAAAESILRRTLGDPAKQLEISGRDGAPMVVEMVIVDPAAQDRDA